MKKIVFPILLVALLASCAGKKQTTSTTTFFSADSAYANVERQLAFGPRTPNSRAHTECAVFLIQHMRQCGAQVELQKGQMMDYSGRPQSVFNVIAHFGSELPGQTVLLCAHYDTRPWCDEEEEYDNRFLNVPGANDGASGVGVLMEIARQLGLDSLHERVTHPVDIVFFDCEDMGTPAFYTGVQRENTWCLGSQLWAQELTDEQSAQYSYGILLDMVGAPDAIFPKEYHSTRYAGNYVEQIWRVAQRQGYGRYFVDQLSYPITDDHYYVSVYGGVPCLDIIHYDTRTSTGFAHWWHTREDDMRNISRETLHAVGDVLMAVLME